MTNIEQILADLKRETESFAAERRRQTLILVTLLLLIGGGLTLLVARGVGGLL